MENVQFLVVLVVWVHLPKFLGKLRNNSVTCVCVLNWFCVVFGTILPGRRVQSYGKRFFIVFLVVWIIFPKFSGRLRSALYYNCMKW